VLARKYPCEVCRTLHGNRGTDPPCETCTPPLDNDRDKEIASLYLLCKNQVILRGAEGEIVDISFSAIKDLLDIYEVRNKKEAFEKILYLFRELSE
jgi:hypothetical protein